MPFSSGPVLGDQLYRPELEWTLRINMILYRKEIELNAWNEFKLIKNESMKMSQCKGMLCKAQILVLSFIYSLIIRRSRHHLKIGDLQTQCIGGYNKNQLKIIL